MNEPNGLTPADLAKLTGNILKNLRGAVSDPSAYDQAEFRRTLVDSDRGPVEPNPRFEANAGEEMYPSKAPSKKDPSGKDPLLFISKP